MTDNNIGEDVKREVKREVKQKQKIVVGIPFLVMLSVLGFWLILYSTSKYGPATTHDSVAYMYAAESLLNGKRLLYFGYDTPFVQWPPLFSFVLSGINLLGCDLVIMSGYLNAFIFALIIFFSGYWLLKGTRNYIIAITGTITILASIPISYVSKYIWSEPLFILFTLLFMISLDNYINKCALRFLIGASIFAALACLTRYIGVTVIITGCILLLIQGKKFINKFVEIVIFGLISAIPTTAWIIRNYLVFNTLAGERTPAKCTFDQNITTAFEIIASWFAPFYSRLALYIILGLCAIMSIIIIMVKLSKDIKQGQGAKESKFEAYRILIPFIFSLIYISYLLIFASTVAFDSINNRLLAPAYVPIIMTMFFTFNEILTYSNGKIRSIVNKSIFIIAYTIWLIYPFTEIITSTQYSHENGAGTLALDWWANSQVIDYIREYSTDNNIYSNFPDAVYIHTRRKACYTPKKDGSPQYGIEKFKKSVENEKDTYIAWFNLDTMDTIYNIEELKDYFSIEIVEKYPDGTIYRIKCNNLDY